MYTHTIDLKSSLNNDGIIYVAWLSSCSFSSTFFVLTNTSILVLTATTLPDSNHPSSRQIYNYLQSFTVTNTYSLPLQSHHYTSLVILSPSCILAIHNHGISILDVASRMWKEQTCDVLTAVPLSPQSYLVELKDGQVIRVGNEGKQEPVLQLEVPSFSLFPLSIPDFHLLAHTQQDKLYLDNVLLASNVTSVAILADLLLYIINDVVPRLCLLPLTQVTSFFEHTQSPTGIPSLPPRFSSIGTRIFVYWKWTGWTSDNSIATRESGDLLSSSAILSHAGTLYFWFYRAKSMECRCRVDATTTHS